jgi:hypothetical protein
VLFSAAHIMASACKVHIKQLFSTPIARKGHVYWIKVYNMMRQRILTTNVIPYNAKRCWGLRRVPKKKADDGLIGQRGYNPEVFRMSLFYRCQSINRLCVSNYERCSTCVQTHHFFAPLPTGSTERSPPRATGPGSRANDLGGSPCVRSAQRSV